MVGLAIPEPPQAALDVFGQCQAIEAWAETVDDIGALRDTAAKLEAIDTYLSRTSTEGRAAVAATMRRLEVRIGELSPRRQGERTDLTSCEPQEVLRPDERSRFRTMAEHRDVVEDVIANSTDERPATRNAVLQAIDIKRARKEHREQNRAELRALMDEINPPDFDPVLNLKRIDALGALEACCREIVSKLDAPPNFLALTRPSMRPNDIDLVRRAHDWLGGLLSLLKKEEVA